MPSPRLYAHRGAGSELPENTIASFRRAIELGADALETDAHLTRDGHVVLSHDETGARMCGVPTAIAAATLDEVRAWDAGFGFVDASGARPQAGKGHRIPTLEELLRELPDVQLNIDAKSRHPQMVPRLLDALKQAKAEDRTLVASFDAQTLRDVRRGGYAGKTGLAQTEVIRLFFSPSRLLARARFALPESAAAAQIPVRAFGIPLATRAFVDKCHALGLEVHFWTINEPFLATRLLNLGADAIMTDDPGRIEPALRRWRREHRT